MVGAALLAPPTLAQDSAGDLENKAFQAIDEERWCDAVAFFLAAHEHKPNVEFLMNAAQASDAADDRIQALSLYSRVVDDFADSPRVADAKKLRAEIAARAADGTGKACPRPATEPLATTAAPDEPPVDTGPSDAVPPPPSAGDEPQPGAEPAPLPAAGEASSSPPLLLIGGGTAAGVGLVVAGAAGGVAAYEYFGVFHNTQARKDDRYLAQALTPWLLAGSAVGGVVLIGGAALVGVALVGGPEEAAP
jgi:hypothetical protein